MKQLTFSQIMRGSVALSICRLHVALNVQYNDFLWKIVRLTQSDFNNNYRSQFPKGIHIMKCPDDNNDAFTPTVPRGNATSDGIDKGVTHSHKVKMGGMDELYNAENNFIENSFSRKRSNIEIMLAKNYLDGRCTYI